MASNIKGITIEIGGNTTKLEAALKDVNKVVYSTNSELKQLNQALKLDPKNTELLSQKQEVLRNNIKATTDRLNTLKEAQRQMGSYASLTEEQKEQYRGLSVEIAKGENALKNMNKELRDSSKVNLDGLKEGLKKVGDVALDVSKKLLQVSAAVGTALAGVVAAGVKSYAEFEQASEGAKLLFGNAYDYIAKKSEEAAATMGLSAKDYLTQVNGLATGLKTYLGGNEQAAAELADRVLTAEADIVAAMGVTQESVQNAFNGIMRGNYTMLDNLRLGITPTKEGFQELIDKVNEWNAEQGKATKYQMGNYADMEAALVDYIKMQGYAGYAANEAAGTITGSINSMKAAFDNFLNGSGSPEQLATAVTNVLTNISKTITELAPSILQGIVQLIQTLIPQVISMLFNLLPQLMDAVSNLIDQLLNMVKGNTDGLADTISTLINKLVEFITTNLPKIIEAALYIIEALALGIVKSLPTMIPSILECIFTIVDTLIDHLDEIILAAYEIIVTLSEGLINALPRLIEKLPEIITKIVMKLTEPEMLLKLIKAALTLILALGKGIIEALPQLITIVPQIIISLVNAFRDRINKTDWGALGSDIIRGICNGFNRIGTYITQKVNEVKTQITNKFKSIFGIHSPSTLMRDTIGIQITAGIGEGIEEGVPQALNEVDAAMKQLNAGIEASVNPTINPTMTYESNYALMAKAMKEALKDMVIEMDDKQMGNFVVKTVAEEIYN